MLNYTTSRQQTQTGEPNKSNAMRIRDAHIEEFRKLYKKYYDKLYPGRKYTHRFEVPEAIAEILLDKMNFSRKKLVDVEAIARYFNIKIVKKNRNEFEDIELSSVLDLSGDIPTITINSEHYETRQRFAIAHELGHYLLHYRPSDEGFVDKRFFTQHEQVSMKMELEANRFAASLLISREVIQSELLKVNNIQELAKNFNVSPAAMNVRLETLRKRLR